MNRTIDSVPVANASEERLNRRIEHADDPIIAKAREIFREIVGDTIAKDNIGELREDLSQLQEEVLDLLRSSPVYEDVVKALVEAKVKAFYAIRGLDAANKKLSYLENRNGELEDRLRRAEEKEEEAKKCGLTGLLHKKYFLRGMFDRLSLMKREVHETSIPVSTVFFDIDKFKSVNDTYGHDLGDEAIRRIGQCIAQKFKREGDVIGKFGGDEFIMVLPNCDIDDAQKLLEELRQEVEDLEFTALENGDSQKFKVTISTGVFTANLFKLNGKYNIAHLVKVLIRGADEQLYYSKKNGRNRVTAASVDMERIKTLLQEIAEEEVQKAESD